MVNEMLTGAIALGSLAVGLFSGIGVTAVTVSFSTSLFRSASKA